MNYFLKSFLAFSLVAMSLPQVLHAATLTVTKVEDTDDGACDPNDCSLREAVIASNTNGATSNIIEFKDLNPNGPEVYLLTLEGDDDTAHFGDLDIRDDLVNPNIKHVEIKGLGADQTIIDASGLQVIQDRVFEVPPNNLDMTSSLVDLKLNDLTITGGNATTNFGGGGILFASVGFTPASTLTINNCNITGNKALPGNGGGLLAISNDPQEDAGIANILINNSTFSANSAEQGDGDGQGGAIATFSVNMQINNSTISGNSADISGGAIDISPNFGVSKISINSSTIFKNSSLGSGGGINVQPGEAALELTFANTILAGNTATMGSPDCSGSDVPFSHGFNIFGNVFDCNIVINNDQTVDVNVTPILDEALADNGGPTPTHALFEGSLAVNTANPDGCFNGDGEPNVPNQALTTDQRLIVPRIVDGRCDVGAYELVPATDISVVKTANSPNVSVGEELSYTLTVTNEGDHEAIGVVLADDLPSETSFVSVNPGDPTCSHANGVVTCQLNSLAPGAVFVATVVVKVNSAPIDGSITNTATVDYAGEDPNPDSNSSSVTTTVEVPLTGNAIEGSGCSLNSSPSARTFNVGSLAFILVLAGFSAFRFKKTNR